MRRRSLLEGLVLGGFITVRADDSVARALSRLAEEASVFQHNAPDLLTRETLRQRALKPEKRKFSPHIGRVAPRPAPEWQTREIVSEYGYATLRDGAIHEFRKPVSIDGSTVADAPGALDRLIRSIRSGNESAKLKLLEDFERLGLIGTAADFGQLLLLFDARGQDRFEFSAAPPRMSGADRVRVIRYQQRDGLAALTIWRQGRQSKEPVGGELWFREPDLVPVRITMSAVFSEKKDAFREEAEVDYAMSVFGVLVPVAVVHREIRGTGLAAENRFTYSTFQKFGASSDVHFTIPRRP